MIISVSPNTEVLFDCSSFATVSMLSAVSNLGVGGTEDLPSRILPTGSSTVCSPYAVWLLVVSMTVHFYSQSSGNQCNSAKSPQIVVGPRLTLFIGTLCYALYVGALRWYVQSWNVRVLDSFMRHHAVCSKACRDCVMAVSCSRSEGKY